MSNLIANLLRGTQGLIAQSKGLEVTGRNLNNVNTEGYSRQRVNLDSGMTMKGPDGAESMGVSIQSVTQARSTFLDRQVQSEKTLTSTLLTKQDIYTQVESALGQGIDTTNQSTGVEGVMSTSGGINGALDEFFASFQELSTNPTDPATKSAVITTASSLVDAINIADERLAGVQNDVTEQIGSDVSSVNQLLKDIAGLNQKIGQYEADAPGSALDLRDQRQSKLEELSKYMNFETRPDPSGNGMIQVFTRDSSNAEVTLVNRQTVTGNVSFTGSSFTAGSPPSTLAFTGGSLQAALDARDTFAQGVRNDLANLANQLRTSVNAAYNPSGTGQDFFAAGTGGKLIEIALGMNATSLSATATGDSGANEIALAVAGVVNKKFSTGSGDLVDGTLGGFFSTTVANVGNAVSAASSNLEDQQLAEQLAVTQRDQVSGVSLDEETANLMKYQRAFQASARYINVIDGMLDTVVNQMGKL